MTCACKHILLPSRCLSRCAFLLFDQQSQKLPSILSPSSYFSLSFSSVCVCVYVWAFGPVVWPWINCFPDWFKFTQELPEPLFIGISNILKTATRSVRTQLQTLVVVVLLHMAELQYHVPNFVTWWIKIYKLQITLMWLVSQNMLCGICMR